jgi:hypothetical protein
MHSYLVQSDSKLLSGFPFIGHGNVCFYNNTGNSDVNITKYLKIMLQLNLPKMELVLKINLLSSKNFPGTENVMKAHLKLPLINGSSLIRKLKIVCLSNCCFRSCNFVFIFIFCYFSH